MSNKQLEIVMVKINDVIPYWRNPRHNDKTVDTLCQVIPVYGFNVPIVLDRNNVIVKGHARLRAARRLGMTEVPCIYTDNDDETNKADRIADNKIQEMSFWDIAKLEMEFQRIGELKFDKLFHPDDYNPFDVQPDKSITFQGTSLDDYGDYTEESVSGDENYDRFHTGNPVSPFTSESEQTRFEGEDFESHVPEMVNGSNEFQSNLPHGKKALRTICPYCGSDVYITLE